MNLNLNSICHELWIVNHDLKCNKRLNATEFLSNILRSDYLRAFSSFFFLLSLISFFDTSGFWKEKSKKLSVQSSWRASYVSFFFFLLHYLVLLGTFFLFAHEQKNAKREKNKKNIKKKRKKLKQKLLCYLLITTRPLFNSNLIAFNSRHFVLLSNAP